MNLLHRINLVWINDAALFVCCLCFWQHNSLDCIYSSHNRSSRISSQRQWLSNNVKSLSFATYLPKWNNFPDSNRTNRNCSTTCSFHLKTFHRSIVNKPTIDAQWTDTVRRKLNKNRSQSIVCRSENTWSAVHSGRSCNCWMASAQHTCSSMTLFIDSTDVCFASQNDVHGDMVWCAAAPRWFTGTRSDYSETMSPMNVNDRLGDSFSAMQCRTHCLLRKLMTACGFVTSLAYSIKWH